MNIDISAGTDPSSEAREILHPSRLPEAGFQSYQKLANNNVNERTPFLDGNIRNPDLRYSAFQDLSDLDSQILRLHEAAEKIDRLITDPEYLAATRSSLEYRIAEMEYIKLLARLDYVLKEPSDGEQARMLASAAQEASEVLYGSVDYEIYNAALAEVWRTLNEKQLNGKALELKNDLENGFTSAEGFAVPAFDKPTADDASLPEFDEAMYWAGEYHLAETADILALLEQWWDQRVDECGDDYVCSPDDIAEAFGHVLQRFDPEGRSEVGVRLVEGATALSWETPELSVLVGKNRDPISGVRTLFTKAFHEFIVHGGRVINGANTQLPALATGLYAGTDYLTFEEGYAVTIEDAMNDKNFSWINGSINYYIGIGEASKNKADFRTVFEHTWRYMLLSEINDTDEVTDAMIDQKRLDAYRSTVRIFRGSPTSQSVDEVGVSLTYNKDLAYFAGRVKAMSYIHAAYEYKDTNALDIVMLGKFDPTDTLQLSLATRAFREAGMLKTSS